MRDRKNLKWKPFNAVIPGDELKSKNKPEAPELSQSKINEIEEYIKYSFYTKKGIYITYLLNGKKIQEKKVVKRIDITSKNIYFTDNTSINFYQIYDIKKESN